jgi:hypothetical protein
MGAVIINETETFSENSKEQLMVETPVERRSEPRTVQNGYYAVNFSLDGTAAVFHFLVWDMSPNGLSLLVKEDSIALTYLRIGNLLPMKFYKADSSEPAKELNTRIMHITKDPQGRFEGHFLVGISTPE